MSELAFASATALAARVQSKDISAVELLNFWLEQTLNGKLNAIVVDTREQALATPNGRRRPCQGKMHDLFTACP